MAKNIRVGIAGLDHFFAGLAAVQELEQDPDAELVIVAHHDVEKLRPVAEKAGARWTTNYREVVDADIDLLITACPTNQNPELVIAGASQGKHILSVKPFAMNLADADRVVAAVKQAGVRFMSFDAGFRFNPVYQQVKSWLSSGQLGRPLSAFCLMRASLPDFVWYGEPFERGRSWWLDPAQSPAGGWLDHSIYFVDALRWLFDSEVTRVSGEVAKLRHPEEAQEDFGVATYVFQNGAIATVEVTWHIESPGSIVAFQLVGMDGHVLYEATREGAPPNTTARTELRRTSFGPGSQGWQTVEIPETSGQVTAHMLQVLRGEAEPIHDEDDARATLAACYAFYDAARERRAIEL